MNLYQRDKAILRSKLWPNDGIIFAAQSLLQKQTKGKVGGWQSPQCSKEKGASKNAFKLVPLDILFVQVLHDTGCHWITVSNANNFEGGRSHDIVLLYDRGAPCGFSKTLKTEVCSFYKPKGDHLRFDVMNAQVQPNGYDCAVYALAAATELAYGCDPLICRWDCDQMREHLVACLEQGKLLRFPSLGKRRIALGSRVRKSTQEQIFCICKTLNDKKRPMIACDLCTKWFHKDCMSLDITKSYKDCMWMCSTCDHLSHH